MRSRKPSAPRQLRLDWDAPGLLAGVDEARRGPLAGPVVAAAVIPLAVAAMAAPATAPRD